MRKLLLLITLLFSLPVFANVKWICISRTIGCHTWVMDIPSGWIVSGDNGSGDSYAMVFIPDPEHKWKL